MPPGAVQRPACGRRRRGGAGALPAARTHPAGEARNPRRRLRPRHRADWRRLRLRARRAGAAARTAEAIVHAVGVLLRDGRAAQRRDRPAQGGVRLRGLGQVPRAECRDAGPGRRPDPGAVPQGRPRQRKGPQHVRLARPSVPAGLAGWIPRSRPRSQAAQPAVRAAGHVVQGTRRVPRRSAPAVLPSGRPGAGDRGLAGGARAGRGREDPRGDRVRLAVRRRLWGAAVRVRPFAR